MTTPPAPTPPPRLAVLLSGGGRTLVNLAAAIRQGILPASVQLVIASKPCAGCDRARALGLEPHLIPGPIPASRLGQLLADHRIDFVVLAGYLTRLEIPPAYRGRIVNIHPALLPAHGGHGMYGRRVHEAVLAAGDTTSGCTVHLVDDEYDRGPIIAQSRVPVLKSDTPESLAARVFEAECATYPAAIAKLLRTLGNEPSAQAEDARPR